MKTVFKLGVLAALSISAPASADRRSFGFTYEYATQPTDGMELELYNTHLRTSFDDGADSAWEHRLAIEYGVTDRTDISLFQVFDQFEDSGLRYAASRVRLRHRFSERGEWPVDLMVLLDVGKPFATPAVDVEPRIVVARDFGMLTAALNLIPAVVITREPEVPGGDKKIETELLAGWAFGLTYDLMPKLKLGAETWGTIHEAFDSDLRTTEGWAGPVVAWAPSTRFWVTTSAGFGITDDSADFVLRFLVGLGL